MGQLLSSTLFKSRDELGLTLYRTYDTHYYSLTSIKLQPDGSLFAAANESGTLIIYDYLSDTDDPQQFRILGYEYGGVSELLWLSQDILAVGTTRGHIVILSFQVNKRYAKEICAVKAHGDGAIQVAVQCLDYCPHTKCLVSVGQGVGSIKIWTVSENGKLNALPGCEKSPTAYCEPRFVSFIAQGSQVLVGFLENASVQRYSVSSWALLDEFILGQEKGATDNRQLGNGILMKENLFILHNLRDGVDVFDPKDSFALLGSARFEVTHCCSQGISGLQNGRYFISASSRGNIYVYRSQDCTLVTQLRVPGRRRQIKAVHSNNAPGDQSVVIATSYSETQTTRISVWTDATRLSTAVSPRRSSESSRLQLVVLCVIACTLCQLAITNMIPVLTATNHVNHPLAILFRPRRTTSRDSILQDHGSMHREAHIRFPDVENEATSVPPHALTAKPTNVDSELPVGIQIQTARDACTSTSTPYQVALATIHPAAGF